MLPFTVESIADLIDAKQYHAYQNHHVAKHRVLLFAIISIIIAKDWNDNDARHTKCNRDNLLH